MISVLYGYLKTGNWIWDSNFHERWRQLARKMKKSIHNCRRGSTGVSVGKRRNGLPVILVKFVLVKYRASIGLPVNFVPEI